MRERAPTQLRRAERRVLTPHEIDLWISVAKTVARFRDAVLPAPPPASTSAKPAPAGRSAKQSAPPAPAPALPASVHKLTPLAPLERKIKRRLARGTQHVDGVLDLHGMTQALAHEALHRFIRRLHAQGGQLAVVITGKGRVPRPDEFGGAGVLRRHVPEWLRAPDMRAMVIGFEEAAAPHGGAGALYVRIRRRPARL